MIQEDIKLLDEVVVLIKSKDDSKQTFTIEAMQKFEFKLFLCLHIARFELQSNNQLTDITADALSKLFAFNSFEYYKYQYPDVFEKCTTLFCALIEYNEKLKSNTLSAKISGLDSQWTNYFKKAIKNLIENTEPRHVKLPVGSWRALRDSQTKES